MDRGFGGFVGRGRIAGWILAAAGLLGGQEVQVPPPPLTDGVFPCTSCHDGKSLKPDTRRRVLKDMHDDIALDHGGERRWCLDCHDAENRDRLRLVNGDRVDFTASFEVCGQCHGDKFRDWRVGVHGKRTGAWNGAKTYQLCVHCHDPHRPRFKPLKPERAPAPPLTLHPRGGAP